MKNLSVLFALQMCNIFVILPNFFAKIIDINQDFYPVSSFSRHPADCGIATVTAGLLEKPLPAAPILHCPFGGQRRCHPFQFGQEWP
jgi:hypothetical protein